MKDAEIVAGYEEIKSRGAVVGLSVTADITEFTISDIPKTTNVHFDTLNDLDSFIDGYEFGYNRFESCCSRKKT